MRWMVLVLVAGMFAGGLAVARADDMETCTKRRAELIKKAKDYKGEARTKRLIEADLSRADRERAEGDGDECLEALDHAEKLLAGKF